MTPSRTTTEISYAASAESRAGRAVIRAIETLTGRSRLIRRAGGYESEIARGRDFWEVMMERFGVTLELGAEDLARIPREGPLLVVANHPFGILDGLALGRILSARRRRFRILANDVFRGARELEETILPISFVDTREARRVNIETRRAAHRHLAGGGAVGVFPGGTVSTARRPFGPPMDPAWRGFTARLAVKSGAAVVPVHFHGANSRLFQLASHLHLTLRLGLLIGEFGRGAGRPLRATIGEPLPAEEIRARAGDGRALMDYLRAETYRLSPTPLRTLEYGLDFDRRRAA